MKYKCLVFDHDDTVVDSTRNIHFPSFVDYMKIKRPEINISLDEYVAINFDPGYMALFKDICGLNDEEIQDEMNFWLNYCDSHSAKAFEGIREIMENHKENGGILAVVSHSHAKYIKRDYENNNLPDPDMIFGIEQPVEERKPAPFPLFKLMEKYDLKPEEILVIDDLKPGLDMAKAAGVPFCAAGWCFDIPENEKYLKENADFYCKTVEDLKKLLDANDAK